MLELLLGCPKSITHAHDAGTIDGDIDVAFDVDYVVVGVTVHLAHDGFAILFWILGLQRVLAKPLAFLFLDVFLLFLVL